MKQVKTRDGSVTFFSKKFNEHYHSITIGAIEEAFEKYVKPAEIQDGDRVLDFCFGLGYNSLAAISYANKLKIVGIENDSEVLKRISMIDVPDEYKEKYSIIKKAASGSIYIDENYKIRLLVDDARNIIKRLDEKFDAVLFDPFSLKVCPELWTKEIFTDLAMLLRRGARLTTYSCAKIVRENLKMTGFEVYDGPIIGRKAPSTIAVRL